MKENGIHDLLFLPQEAKEFWRWMTRFTASWNPPKESMAVAPLGGSDEDDDDDEGEDEEVDDTDGGKI